MQNTAVTVQNNRYISLYIIIYLLFPPIFTWLPYFHKHSPTRTTIFQLALALGVALAFTIIGRTDNPQAALDGLQATWILGIACYIFQIFLFAFFGGPAKTTKTKSARFTP